MKRVLMSLAGMVLAAGLLAGCSPEKGTEVTTAIAKTDGDVSALSWHGNIEAEKSIAVFPNGTGKVTEILAKEGSRVAAGDVLFKLDGTDAELSLKQAEAGCKAAQAAYAGAEAANSGNTTVTPAQISYNDAKDNYVRARELFDAGAVSQVELDGAKSRMDASAAQLDSAKNGQKGSFDSASAQLESAQAALEIAKKRLNDCTVASPIDGLVTSVSMEAGQTVSTQTAAVTVMDDSREHISIQVADMDITQIAVAQPMDIYLQALGQTVQGAVQEISPVCDPKTGMFTVKVNVSQAEQSLIGLSADVNVPAGQAARALYVPAKCIQTEAEKSCVYLIRDGHAVRTEVAVGQKRNAYMEVTSGLNAGDEVVMQSSVALSDGMSVRVISVK